MHEKPNDPIPAERYLALGSSINALEHATGMTFAHIKYWLAIFTQCSDLLGFSYPNKSFESFSKRLDQIDRITPSHHIPGPLAEELRQLVHPIAETIFKDATARQTIALNTASVSTRVQQLPTELKLTDAQKRLLEETARCLECGAYRSAAVMGWNLAYDYVRRWTFDNHLSDFNSALIEGYTKKSGQPVYTAISEYDDFLKGDAPGEKVVLDTLLAAQKIGGNLHEDLRKHLRQRNKYAHPSDVTPTVYQVNAFVEELVDIITRAPFK